MPKNAQKPKKKTKPKDQNVVLKVFDTKTKTNQHNELYSIGNK